MDQSRPIRTLKSSLALTALLASEHPEFKEEDLPEENRPYYRNIAPLKLPLGLRKTVKTLGRGTYGRVNLQRGNSGYVATKYFLSSHTIAENVVEIALLKYLKGKPNVAQIIDVVDSPEDFPAAVMATAHSSLVNESLYKSWSDIYNTCVQILHGYHVLHSMGIAHRDTKPQNMLMTSYANVLITDFGVGRYIPEYAPAPKDGYTGTIWYASPEVLLKSLVDPKRRSYTRDEIFANDCWAVGVTLLRIIKGVDFIEGADPKAVVRRIIEVIGNPTPEDGEIYTLCKNMRLLDPDIKHNRDMILNIVTRRQYKPVNLDDPIEVDQLSRLAVIIKDLLNYNNTKRMTMREALLFLGEEPKEFPHTPIYRSVLSKSSNSGLKFIYDKIITLTNSESLSKQISPDTRHLVIDRAFLYAAAIYNALLRPDGTVSYPSGKSVMLSTIAETALCLSSWLMDNDIGIFVDAVGGAYIVKNIKDLISHVMKLNIPLVGHTLMDEIILEMYADVPLQMKISHLNMLCFTEGFYQEYAVDIVKQAIKNVAPILVADKALEMLRDAVITAVPTVAISSNRSPILSERGAVPFVIAAGGGNLPTTPKAVTTGENLFAGLTVKAPNSGKRTTQRSSNSLKGLSVMNKLDKSSNSISSHSSLGSDESLYRRVAAKIKTELKRNRTRKNSNRGRK